MEKVLKYSVSNGTFQEQYAPENDMLRKIRNMSGIKFPVLVVDATGADEIPEWKNLVAKGITHEGETYVPLFVSASGARKATSTWVAEPIYQEIGKWAMCGLESRNMVIAASRYLAYLGLLWSATKPMKEVFGFDIDIRRVCVLPDVENSITSLVDVIEGDELKKEFATWRNNASDGLALIRSNLTGGKSFTGRGPWLKFFALASNIAAWAKKAGVSLLVEDVYGNQVNLAEVDLILTRSCFKMYDQYSSFEEYQDAFERLAHKISVCVTEHPGKGDLPYQQLQTLVAAGSDDIRSLCDSTVNGLAKYKTIKGASRMLGGSFGQAALLYPPLLKHPHSKRMLQETYTNRRNRTAGGRVPGVSRNLFIAPDPVAIFQGMLGLPISGVLKRGEVSTQAFPEGEIDVTRSPHLNEAHCVRLNRRLKNRWFAGDTLYVSVVDSICLDLQADFDGDHVNVTNNPRVIDLAKRSIAMTEYSTLLYSADKAAKAPITASVVRQYISRLTEAAPIGLYANALTKMWATGYDPVVCASLTKDANTQIDAAKHSSSGRGRGSSNTRVWKDIPLPRFLAYAKNPKEPGLFGKDTMETAGVGDSWCREVLRTTPEKLVIEDLPSEDFNYYVLMSHGRSRLVKNLCVGNDPQAKFPGQEGYERLGLFQQLAYRKLGEWQLAKEGDYAHRAAFEDGIVFEARKEIFSFAECMGYTRDDAIDTIIRYLYDSRKEAKLPNAQLYRTLWSFFGKEILRNIKNNLAEEAFTNEDLFDVDDDFDGVMTVRDEDPAELYEE